MKNLILNFWVYVYPIPACAFFYYYWNQNVGQSFALFMILVPLLYGYIIPGIATNIQKKWKFHTKFKLGDYYAHHGFKISGNMNTWFFLASLGLPPSNFSFLNSISLIVSTGAIMGFFTWWHDTAIIRRGKLELKSVLVHKGMSAEEKAYSYSPACFFSLGAGFALSALGAHHYFITYPTADLIPPLILGFITVSTPASLVFTLLEKKALRELTPHK